MNTSSLLSLAGMAAAGIVVMTGKVPMWSRILLGIGLAANLQSYLKPSS